MERRDLLRLAALAAAAHALPAIGATSALPAATGHRSDALNHALRWRHDGQWLRLGLRRKPAPGPVVLYVHGATFPSALSVDWAMDGISWMDDLQRSGLDAWAFDFAGFGDSDRPAAFDRPADAGQPFGTCAVAADQITQVLVHIRSQRPAVPLYVIAHSWGTLPAQQVAIERPELIDRLVLFGPIARREGTPPTDPAPAWYRMGRQDQRPRHRSGLPDGEPTPVSDAEIERWCDAYLASDPAAGNHAPPVVTVPGGPTADLASMWSGRAVIDPAKVRQPVMIVRGQWDHVTTDADARWLFDALGTPDKRDVKLAGGNHWLHLQPQRTALWAQTRLFLE